MERFLEIFRAEFEKELQIGGNYANKATLMAAFDKAFARAIAKYAGELGINLI